MSGNSVTNDTAIALARKTQGGIKKYFTALPIILLAGMSSTPDKLVAIFQDDIDATEALEAAEAEVKQKRAVQKAARATAIATRGRLKAYILGNYGEQAVQMLNDCGYEPPKPKGAQTVASKAKGVAQAKATRAARGTKGSRQRKAIHGTVAAPAPEPVTPPAPGTTPVTK